MTLEEIRLALHDRNLQKVAAATGLHPITLGKIRSGKTQDPSYRTVVTLENYLTGDKK